MTTTFLLTAPGNNSGSNHRAAQALRQSRIPALRQLCVEESDTGIIITGRVGSYYLKQLAQETIMPVLDHRELRNQVIVIRS